MRFGPTTRIEPESVSFLRAAASTAGVVERSTFVPASVKRVANVALPPATINRVCPLPRTTNVRDRVDTLRMTNFT